MAWEKVVAFRIAMRCKKCGAYQAPTQDNTHGTRGMEGMTPNVINGELELMGFFPVDERYCTHCQKKCETCEQRLPRG